MKQFVSNLHKYISRYLLISFIVWVITLALHLILINSHLRFFLSLIVFLSYSINCLWALYMGYYKFGFKKINKILLVCGISGIYNLVYVELYFSLIYDLANDHLILIICMEMIPILAFIYILLRKMHFLVWKVEAEFITRYCKTSKERITTGIYTIIFTVVTLITIMTLFSVRLEMWL